MPICAILRKDAANNGDVASGEVEPSLGRHDIMLGIRADRTEVLLGPYGTSVLLVGSSAGGESTLAAGVLERLVDCECQFCVVDLEGNYRAIAGAIALEDSQREARTGRPHWIVVDEAHHLLPASSDAAALTLPGEFDGIFLITVDLYRKRPGD